MKKSILIFCAVIVTLSLTAFGFKNWSQTVSAREAPSICNVGAFDKQLFEEMNDEVLADFFYDVGTRFRAIKKEDLDKARSISDFLSRKQIQLVASYKSTHVTILDDGRETDISETGNGDVFTAAQIKLLRSAGYSSNILIEAAFQQKNFGTCNLEDSYFTPYLTIVPETQAAYLSGKAALIEYVKENSKEKTAIVKEDKLQSGKLYFTVTKKGTISNVKLVATSGYTSIDKKMIELVSTLPGKWDPAVNSKGKKVDQELVFSFGVIGC